VKKSLDTKIAIIGAGPSGLGAAEALREKGYKNITVFDKSGRVGGQSLSCEYVTPDNRRLVYDMGSVQPLGSKILFRLLKQNGLSFGRGPLENKKKVFYAYSHLRGGVFVDFVRHYLGVPVKYLPLLLADLSKLSYYLVRYKRLAKPGFHDFKYWDETTLNFKDWVEARKFKIIGPKLNAIFLSLMTLTNKNNEGKVHTYLAFKFLFQLLATPIRYIDGTYRPVKEGYQELWKRVAKNFETVLNADIKSINRSESGVMITTADQSYQFDELIISCPFDRISAVLDVKPAEKAAFTDIHYHPGYRGAFVAKDGPIDGIYWDPDTYDTGNEPPYLSMVIPEGKIDDSTYLYSCVFAHCPDAANAVNILQTSATKVFKEEYNADITEWVKMQYWSDYSCQFGIDAVNNRAYDKVHALQGNNRTHYTGLLLSFSAHSTVVDYSYDLVKSFY
jgi:hypothetical protein